MMRRLDNRTVELTPLEAKAHDMFEERLDAGDTISQAADTAIRAHREVSFTFQEWLRGLADCP